MSKVFCMYKVTYSKKGTNFQVVTCANSKETALKQVKNSDWDMPADAVVLKLDPADVMFLANW